MLDIYCTKYFLHLTSLGSHARPMGKRAQVSSLQVHHVSATPTATSK